MWHCQELWATKFSLFFRYFSSAFLYLVFSEQKGNGFWDMYAIRVLVSDGDGDGDEGTIGDDGEIGRAHV